MSVSPVFGGVSGSGRRCCHRLADRGWSEGEAGDWISQIPSSAATHQTTDLSSDHASPSASSDLREEASIVLQGLRISPIGAAIELTKILWWVDDSYEGESSDPRGRTTSFVRSPTIVGFGLQLGLLRIWRGCGGCSGRRMQDLCYGFHCRRE